LCSLATPVLPLPSYIASVWQTLSSEILPWAFLAQTYGSARRLAWPYSVAVRSPPALSPPPRLWISVFPRPCRHSLAWLRIAALSICQKDETRANIAKASGVSVAQLVSWSPSIGSDCTGMWSSTYVCVSIVHTPTILPHPSRPQLSQEMALPRLLLFRMASRQAARLSTSLSRRAPVRPSPSQLNH